MAWIKNRDRLHEAALSSVKAIAKRKDLSSKTGISQRPPTAFISTGFSLGDDVVVNTNTENYISWNWAADEAFSNDASSTSVGSIDSAGKVGTAAGISIIGWAGTGSAGTIAHGLSKAPEVIWFKNRDKTSQFSVYYGDNTDYLALIDALLQLIMQLILMIHRPPQVSLL